MTTPEEYELAVYTVAEYIQQASDAVREYRPNCCLDSGKVVVWAADLLVMAKAYAAADQHSRCDECHRMIGPDEDDITFFYLGTCQDCMGTRPVRADDQEQDAA